MTNRQFKMSAFGVNFLICLILSMMATDQFQRESSWVYFFASPVLSTKKAGWFLNELPQVCYWTSSVFLLMINGRFCKEFHGVFYLPIPQPVHNHHQCFPSSNSGGQCLFYALYFMGGKFSNRTNQRANTLSFEWPKSMESLKDFAVYGGDGQTRECQIVRLRQFFGLDTLSQE